MQCHSQTPRGGALARSGRCLAVLVLGLAAGCSGSPSKPSGSAVPTGGGDVNVEPLPVPPKPSAGVEFQGVKLPGVTEAVDKYKGKVVLLNFWSIF